MNKIKKFIEDSCYWLTILMPISMSLGRGVADANLTSVAILFFLISIVKKDLNPFKEKWFLIALTLWVYLLIRSIFSDDAILAMKKVIPFIRFPLFALCLQHLVSKRDDANKNIIFSLIISVIFLVCDGYIQYFFGKDLFGHLIIHKDNHFRLTGPFSKQFFGAYVTVLSMPLLAISIYYISKGEKILLSTLFCIAVYIIVFLSGERSSLIQTTLGLLTIISIFSLRNKKILIIGPILAVVIIVALYNSTLQQVINRQFFSILEIIKNYSDSPYGKLWNAGIAMGFKNLVFGVGPMHFETNCEMITDFCAYHPHNIYIEFFAETGIIGLSLFLYLLYAIIKNYFLDSKNHKDQFLKTLALGVLIAIIIRLLPVPSSGFFKNWYAVPLWFMVGWLLCLGKSKFTRHPKL